MNYITLKNGDDYRVYLRDSTALLIFWCNSEFHANVEGEGDDNRRKTIKVKAKKNIRRVTVSEIIDGFESFYFEINISLE